MTLSAIGVVTILLIIYTLIKGKDALMNLTIFSTVFIAAAAINITGIVGVSPFHLCGIALIIQTLTRMIKNKQKITKEEIKMFWKENKVAKALIIFFIVMCISILGIIILKINIVYTNFQDEEAYVKFGFENIKDIVHIGFIFTISILFSIKLDTKEKNVKAIKVFMFATFLSLIWGVIQIILFAFNIPYPYWLFNNSISFAQLYMSQTNGMQRVNSFAPEVSQYAPIVLAFLSIITGKIIMNVNKNVINKKYILLFILAMIIAILTTSSTTYLCVGVISLFTFFYILFFKNKDNQTRDKKKIIFTFAVILIISVLLTGVIFFATKYTRVATKDIWNTEDYSKEGNEKLKDKDDKKNSNKEKNPNGLMNTIFEMTINKAKSESANQRIVTDLIGIELTLKNNILTGIGQGSFRTFDLFTNIFVNTGIIGCIVYVYLLIVVYKQIFKIRKENDSVFIILFNLITSITIAFVSSIPDFIFAYYWILIVIVYNYCIKKKEEVKVELREDKNKQSNKVSIILLNYNGANDTIQCIKSIKENEKNLDYDIVVVDNKSTDDSIKKLEKLEGIIFLKNEENRGFAAGNNYGIKYAIDNGAEYILLLNNDTEIEKNAISIMLENYKKHKEVGIMGARIMYSDNKELINYCGGHINFTKATVVHEHYREKYVKEDIECKQTDFITGCTMLFSKEIIEKVGYLPEEYFMYYEDADYCIKTKEKGFKLFISLNSIIYHKVSSSSGGEQSPFSIKWGTRNRIVFMSKFRQYTSGIYTYLFFYFTRIIKVIEYTLKGKNEEKNAVIQGIKEGKKMNLK